VSPSSERIRRRAHARNVSFQFLYDGQFVYLINSVDTSKFVCSNRGSFAIGFFSIHFTITGLKNMVRYAEGPLIRVRYVGVALC